MPGCAGVHRQTSHETRERLDEAGGVRELAELVEGEVRAPKNLNGHLVAGDLANEMSEYRVEIIALRERAGHRGEIEDELPPRFSSRCSPTAGTRPVRAAQISSKSG